MAKQVATAAPVAAKKELHVVVETYGSDGKQNGTRIVDMYHPGTRNWLQNHIWWAMHNSCTIEQRLADAGEVSQYIEAGKLALADKFQAA